MKRYEITKERASFSQRTCYFVSGAEILILKPKQMNQEEFQQEPRREGPRETPPAAAQQTEQPRRDERAEKYRRRYDRRRGHGQRRDGKLVVSVVIPLYNEEHSLRELHEQLRSALNRSGPYELIFVDDGSTDNSFRVLQELRQRDHRIKIIRFRRNYGKSAALSVGFHNAGGEVVVTMDADLQDDPNEIPNLVNEVRKGYDLVSGWKKKRFDPITKTIPSRFFNFVTAVISGIPLHDFNCGLKAYRKDVVKDVKVYGELHRYIPVLAHRKGYRIGEVIVRHHPRKYGKTKFGAGRFWKGFLDLLTVLFTTRYFRRPLHLFGFWGILFFLIGFSVDLYLTVLKLWFGEALGNRPLFFLGILLIIVGVQFISLGLLGEMISKVQPTTEEDYSIRDFIK
jgi:glycosyltransferase involved in cell wall biosynthesis